MLFYSVVYRTFYRVLYHVCRTTFRKYSIIENIYCTGDISFYYIIFVDQNVEFNIKELQYQRYIVSNNSTPLKTILILLLWPEKS